MHKKDLELCPPLTLHAASHTALCSLSLRPDTADEYRKRRRSSGGDAFGGPTTRHRHDTTPRGRGRAFTGPPSPATREQSLDATEALSSKSCSTQTSLFKSASSPLSVYTIGRRSLRLARHISPQSRTYFFLHFFFHPFYFCLGAAAASTSPPIPLFGTGWWQPPLPYTRSEALQCSGTNERDCVFARSFLV